MSTFICRVIAGIAEDMEFDEYRLSRPLDQVTLAEFRAFASEAVRGAISHVKPDQVKEVV